MVEQKAPVEEFTKTNSLPKQICFAEPNYRLKTMLNICFWDQYIHRNHGNGIVKIFGMETNKYTEKIVLQKYLFL